MGSGRSLRDSFLAEGVFVGWKWRFRRWCVFSGVLPRFVLGKRFRRLCSRSRPSSCRCRFRAVRRARARMMTSRRGFV